MFLHTPSGSAVRAKYSTRPRFMKGVWLIKSGPRGNHSGRRLRDDGEGGKSYSASAQGGLF